ncbi:nuclear transport factor 2 family protein [bacterium]|nr:nuclear transport factor 2 family protein [bacterium]
MNLIVRGIFVVLIMLTSSPLFAGSRESLDKVLKDYIGLYQKDTLDQWKTLFHPSVTIFFPTDDGGINVRNLEEFLERQKNYFEKRKSIRERLQNVQILEGKRIARVTADFIFIDEGVDHPGKLGLHLVEGQDGWKIVGVLFSYDNR